MTPVIGSEKSIQPPRMARSKAAASREVQQLDILYNKTMDHYLASDLSRSISHLLESKTRPKVNRIVSLGLGSFKSIEQPRRLKQLSIFLAIAQQLEQGGTKIDIYAQDPVFSKTDEAFLQRLGVRILSTPSVSELGEARQYFDDATLVYCPFLTLEAYKLLFSTGCVHFFIGDDFDALRLKWHKNSIARGEAESLLRQFVQGYRKRVITDSPGFWDDEDKPFPMAMYWNTPNQRSSVQQVDTN